MAFFDLFFGLRGLFDYQKYFLPGYHALGLTDLTAEIAGQRIETFLQRALFSERGK